MTEQLQGLLLNFLFIVVCILFVPLVLDTHFKKLTSPQKKVLLLLSCSIAIISTMIFRIEIVDSLNLDLRWIPVMAGALYINRYSVIILTGVVVATRGVIGIDTGFYWTCIVGIIVIISLLTIYPFFHKQTKTKRILLSSCIVLYISFIVQGVILIIFNVPFNFSFFITYSLIYLGSAIFVIYFIELMRETRYVNNQIIKAKKIEIVSHLASSISHEVRNPLAVVSGFLQMMKLMEIEADKRREFIDISLQEIERANDIIRNYLTFAKPAPENYEIIDIKEELYRAIEIITPLANMNCVEVFMDIHTHLIYGQNQLIQQCLLNITKNCIEAMPNGGKLMIHTKQQGNKILVEISDTGVGMTKEQLSRLGEPYYTTKGREGTGLGMMAVLQIVDMLNGELNVVSEVNKGTTFTITFQREELIS